PSVDASLTKVNRELHRPFELSKGPLLRVVLIEIDDGINPVQKRIMKVDMHHIITDATSLTILQEEFFAQYNGESQPPLKIQYREYAEWQGSSRHRQNLEQQEKYWRALYTGEIPVLNLPTDYARPAIQRFEGDKVTFDIPEEDAERLKETVKENNTTPYMTILAIYTILLSKLSGQQDIIIGTPTAGRSHADIE
ncbi:MAG: hypothetical protein GY765_15580, partial [bacterium]|nr:hypothetical protein [bacterium]